LTERAVVADALRLEKTQAHELHMYLRARGDREAA
jgi:hypothetical protein